MLAQRALPVQPQARQWLECFVLRNQGGPPATRMQPVPFYAGFLVAPRRIGFGRSKRRKIISPNSASMTAPVTNAVP